MGHEPYPWQQRFYARAVAGELPDAVDIPTGLGKTLCVLLVLLARLRNRALPRRIVYVVDRRAIVDQTAESIRTWVERIGALEGLSESFDAQAAFAAKQAVALGVLRGGLADDGQWRADPARPTMVVGTVDMVGSRLLFRGYGDGRWKRPLHAGLLGHDALVMLDEAHLSPAMEELLGGVQALQEGGGFRRMTLSATKRGIGQVEGLSEADRKDAHVRRRLRARKVPHFVEVRARQDRVSAICQAALKHRTGAVLAFVESVEDAKKVAAKLKAGLGRGEAARVALLTGTLRGRERAAVCTGSVWGRFGPGRQRVGADAAVYLVTTAAGEVGVDLDADHAVMDVTPLDSMVQRLGRVNRGGRGKAEVTVVCMAEQAQASKPAAKTYRARRETACARTLALLKGIRDLCPAALRAVNAKTWDECTVSSVLAARLDAAVVEAFSATSTDLNLPPVEVYLRGVSEEPHAPDTWLAWRRDVGDLVGAGAEAAKAALSFYRLGAEELARVPARVAERIVRGALERRGGRGLPLVVISAQGEVSTHELEEEALPTLDFATVVLPVDAGGLRVSGVPDERVGGPVEDVADHEDRVRYVEVGGVEQSLDGGPGLPEWVEGASQLRIPLADGEDDSESERTLVYALRRPDADLDVSETDLSWLGASTQTVAEHCARVGDAARRIGEAVGLDAQLSEALGHAGAWHDQGKARRVWQRAAGTPPDGPALAKSTRGRLRVQWLGGYRHEFGSLADAECALPADTPHRDLILHLVAAHHGWGRPGFPKREQWDPEGGARENRERAQRVARRFADLQAQHGPWRLAWLEALLKAADAWVSAETGN